MHTARFFILFLLLGNALFSQNRPTIGLTLSGGGAKGLAHVGLLQALDSAGLKVDYITGTSMGSIGGSLYAIGYSGKEIEGIARSIDWDAVLTNQSPLYRISMEEKPEYGKYAFELPFKKKKISLPSGVIEGQELWTTFSELYFPVYDITDFYDFSIPFKCVATDVVTGKGVVMDCGDITKSVRASMAIPMVFTAVDTLNYRLVDGGIVRNFPVQDVIDMGADYVIGSSVSYGLLPEEKLNNVVDIILQLLFLKEAEDYENQKKLCDFFIQMPIQEFSTGSFDQADSIIELGKKHAFEVAFPHFKALADSLNAIYPNNFSAESRLPKVDSVFIDTIEVLGLSEWESDFFRRLIDFQGKRYYQPKALSEMTRRAYGTRFYSSISYSLERVGSKRKIVFLVRENPHASLKVNLHYTEMTSISGVVNLTKRDFLFKNSRAFLKLNIGPNFRLRGEHLQYLGNRKRMALIPSLQYDLLDFTTFDGRDADGVLRQRQLRSELRLQSVGHRTHASGIGLRYDVGQQRPLIDGKTDIWGNNEFLSLFAYHQINNTDRQFFPRKGLKLEGEGAWIPNQSPNIRYSENGVELPVPDDLNISENGYTRFWINAEWYIPLNRKFTLLNNAQLGANFNNQGNVLNDFRIGGLNRLFYNQLVFNGLQESSRSEAALATFGFGFRYEWKPDLYITLQSNAAVYDFLPSSGRSLSNLPFLSGHALSVAYDSPIGPISITGTFGDQAEEFGYFVNLGVPFF